MANDNPGHDTITLTPGLVIDWHGCYPTAPDPFYTLHITESVKIEGNGGRLQGRLAWVSEGGIVNPLGRCPSKTAGTIMISISPAFARIGDQGADNSGITVDVNNLDMDQLTSVARVYEKATLNISGSELTKIRDVIGSCNRSALDIWQGANLSISDSTIKDARTWADSDRGGWAGVIAGFDGGQLDVDKVDFIENRSGGAINWGGQGANVVSSRFLYSEGVLLYRGPMTIVNSAFQIDEAFKDPMRLYSATGSGGMTFRASTVAIPLVDCATPCTKGFGVPFLAQESAIHFEQTAVGVGLPTASTEKLLGVSGTGSYTADTQTWIQPVKSQNAAALQTITGQPALLTDAPGLPNLPPWVQQYPTSVTPLNPGELINVIDNAASGQSNQLLNPIDGTFITKDVFGNNRVDGNDKRDIGAVQLTLAPHLAVVSEASTKVGLHWTQPPDPSTGPLTGYEVLYREAGSSGPWTSKDIAGAGTVSAVVAGLTNGTEYEFTVSAVNASRTGPPSNLETGTPLGEIGTPVPTAVPGNALTNVSWPVPDSGGHTLSGYSVVYRPVGETVWKSAGTVTDIYIEITGLTNGTEYEIGVTAHATDGRSSALGTTTVTPVEPKPTGTPKVTGGGFIVADGRTSFGLIAKSQGGGFHGQLQVSSEKDRFHGDAVDVLVVEDRTATFSGTGRWNGQDGYTYEVSVIDRVSASADHISIVIRDGSDGIMLDTSGDLKGGNVTIRH